MKQFETFRLDTANECLWRDGKQIDLPPKPFAVLRYLVDNPGRLITHDELLEALWPETYVQPQVLRTYMLELRKLLGDDAGQPRFIQTQPKRGYRFVATVKDWQDPSKAQQRPDTSAGSANASGKGSKNGSDANGSDALNQAALSRLELENTSDPADVHFADLRFIDRKEELDALQSQVKLLLRGDRCIVFVTGEAGIGKSMLVDAFCRQTESFLPGSIARGQCIEGFGPKEEYYPVMEALGHLCSSPLGERVCSVLARVAPSWLAALGRTSGPPGSAPAGPTRMPGDLCAALEEIAIEAPLIVVLEDLHWADVSTLQLISALARRRARTQLMILASFNPQQGGADHPLKALQQDLRMRRLCAEIVLKPFGRQAIADLLRRELAQDALPAGLANFIHRHSEGNPLFIIALLEHLMAEGHLAKKIDQGTTRWEPKSEFADLDAGVPDGLAQMIELEIERLGEREQRLLEAGSLMDVVFPSWAVAAALEADQMETEEACDALARRLHFLQRAGQDEMPDGSSSAFYAFDHGLYRQVLYRRQPDARRARRHARIAERLGEIFAGRESLVAREMAMHFEAGRQWQKAMDALRMAAGHAVERRALAEAAEMLQHALKLAANLPGAEQKLAADAIREELSRVPQPSQDSGIIRQELAGKL